MSNWARAGRGLGSLRPQTGLSPVSPPNELTAVVRRSYGVGLGCDGGEGHSLQLRWRRGTQPAAAAWDGGKASVSRLPR